MITSMCWSEGSELFASGRLNMLQETMTISWNMYQQGNKYKATDGVDCQSDSHAHNKKK
jgi:hypothetical protein